MNRQQRRAIIKKKLTDKDINTLIKTYEQKLGI